MRKAYSAAIILFSLLVIITCTKKTESKESETTSEPEIKLPSWKSSEQRSRIIDFVSTVSDPNSSNYVPPEDRIAVFDNDGTLWVEKPLYNHLYIVLSKIEELVEDRPELLQDTIIKSLHNFSTSRDMKSLSYFVSEINEERYLEVVGQLFGKAFEGEPVEVFESNVKEYYTTWNHPVLKKPLDGLTYGPMKELISLLTDHQFNVFIFTADEGAFLKLFSQDLYDIPAHNVFGSQTKLRYSNGNLTRTSEGSYFNNWENKAELIYHVTGRRPIFAAGNSNGDFHMLEYVSSGVGINMSLLLHHTDSLNEFSYDSHTDKVMPYALENDYLIVDMANDWSSVFD